MVFYIRKACLMYDKQSKRDNWVSRLVSRPPVFSFVIFRASGFMDELLAEPRQPENAFFCPPPAIYNPAKKPTSHMSGNVGHLRATSSSLKTSLGPSWAIWGGSWGDLGAILGNLGPSWGHFATILGHLGAILGRLGAILGHLSPI